MKFRSEIEPLKMAGLLKHDSPIVMLGSCFSDEISKKLRFDGFDVLSNPFGPIYSPTALSRLIKWVYENENNDNIFFHDGLWRTFYAHTKLSFPEKEQLEREIAKCKEALISYFKRAQAVILTLGSARSYLYNDEVVANCHKLPANNFKTHLSTPEQVAENLNYIAKVIRTLNAECRIILTISPIRHGGFGLHGNQVSKAILMLGVESYIETHQNDIYFPSYEIVLDDLRDYRFYADDLKHPSPFAINYIYEKFCDSFFNDRTRLLAKEFHNLSLKLQHQIIGNDDKLIKAHEKSIDCEIERIYSGFPELGNPDINRLKHNLCTL